MQTYNKIMYYFWLVAAVLIFIGVTYMGFKDDFRLWGYYYVLGVIALFAAITRRWMMKRMERNHAEFYEKEESQKD